MALTPRQEVLFSILSYSFCSGTLVLLNKLTLHYLPFPSLVVVVQLISACIIIYGMEFLGYVKVDSLRWECIKPYLLYTFFFSTGVYCNMRSLAVSNVETVIVFRALTPCVVAFLDAMFLGREWPSLRSWAGLLLLVIGAYGYASYDVKFQTQGYGAYIWPSLYTIVIALEMAYGKKIVRSVDLKTKSGPVIYTNLLGILPMMALATVKNEYSNFYDSLWADENHRIPPASIPLLILGCLVGTGIGYSGWWCRDVVSATSFTLVGVMNKCLTVLLNLMIWEQHANPGGIACLMICIGGGIVYKQSPMRNEKGAANAVANHGGEVFRSDSSVGSVGSNNNKSSEEMDLLERQKDQALARRV